ncbi:hypothetical protein BABINDRAFT_161788 [Babjeviella inositovora NRRL Y-12698]|uniref:RRM domain-containing protein n=1 Tax=Babjeviella inositovora NRRL Y-12698 TaxID=984486 RepID=A0A1E3QNX8_9ASCO|nr:uncharacterized protein BABINDRAFT_161788 [Babjeviella inositovora NRRL Y-12698]ODQ79385.1 hypothetical protein BABINDRAFT_161788 [Babjeviella inositovora NRRL Y-12698]
MSFTGVHPEQSGFAPPMQALGANHPTELASNFPIPQPPNESFVNSSVKPRTLWMGDLDPWATEESVGQIWNNVGKNVLVKLIRVKRGSHQGDPNFTPHSGYCFVEFDSFDDAQYALSLNGSPIPNASDGSDHSGSDSGNFKAFRLNWAAGATLSSPISQSPEYSLFVGDLSPQTTEAHLLALFQTKYQSIKTVRVMTDPVSGSSRCFGFVRFSNEFERSQAVAEMQGVWLSGRPLRVAFATPRNIASNSSPSAANGLMMSHAVPPHARIPSHPLGMPAHGGYENYMLPPGMAPAPGYHGISPQQPPMPFYPQQASGAGEANSGNPSMPPQAPKSMAAQAFTDPTNTTVFVGGLTSGVPEQTLLQLFQPFGHILHVKIPPGKGCGFVRFGQREDAERAIAGMQGFAISGSRIRLSWGRSQHNGNMAGNPHPNQMPPHFMNQPQQFGSNGNPGASHAPPFDLQMGMMMMPGDPQTNASNFQGGFHAPPPFPLPAHDQSGGMMGNRFHGRGDMNALDQGMQRLNMDAPLTDGYLADTSAQPQHIPPELLGQGGDLHLRNRKNDSASSTSSGASQTSAVSGSNGLGANVVSQSALLQQQVDATDGSGGSSKLKEMYQAASRGQLDSI